MEQDREQWMKKDRMRKKLSYKPVSELTHTELKKRRDETNRRVKKHYALKKQVKQRILESGATPSAGTRSNIKSPLVVKLPFNKKGVQVNRRYKNSLLQKNRQISKLTNENADLKRRVWVVSKHLQRRTEKSEVIKNGDVTPRKSQVTNEIRNLTPKSKTRWQMKEAGLKPLRTAAIWKALMFANTMAHSMKDKLQSTLNRASKRMLTASLSGKIIKKYRCCSVLRREAGIGRTSAYNIQYSRKKRDCIQTKFKGEVISFLEREDNSTIMPGIKDVVKVDGEIKQKHILNDYLHNLHMKFCLEHPDINMSRSTFYLYETRTYSACRFCQ
jgi:hypothetical protein